VGLSLIALLGMSAALLRAARIAWPGLSGSQLWAFPMFWWGLGTYLALWLGAIELALFVRRKMARRTGAPSEPVDEGRRRFLSRAVAGSALAASGALSTYGAWHAFEGMEVTDLALKLRGLPKAMEGFSIVQLTDVHIGNLVSEKFTNEIVGRCNALKPDMVVITGDLVDGDVATLGPVVARLRELSSKYGTYFVTGNHEYYSGDEPWCAALPSFGVQVLRNRFVRIGDEAASFDLIGVDDWGAVSQFGRGYDLDLATVGRDVDRPAVLLAHQPRGWEKASERGVGLQLSGHTHGGQFFPFTAAVRVIWKHPAGLFSQSDSHLYVSRGTGFWGPPLRVGSAPEIVRVSLLSG
jgi:predicted MPP superfamily phosphohydrolase